MTVEVKKIMSAKTKKEYTVLDIKFTDNYTKRVFLEPAEIALLDVINKH